MSIFDTADELAAILEPIAGNRDDARMRPFEYVAGKLYIWPIAEKYTSIDTGGNDRLDFRLRTAWAAPALQEEAGLAPDRTISQAIQNKARAYRDAIVTARVVAGGGTTWNWLAVDAVDYDQLSNFGVRGFLMDVTGYTNL